VEYNVIDSFNGVDKPARRYVAIIRYDLSDSFVRYDDRFLNLDGIQVTRFDVRKG
jgi:type IV secretory pathway component VirB8